MEPKEFTEILRVYNLQRLPHNRGSLCHAPSVSLNFEQSGVATACCYNRRFILGRYPKNTIKDIWDGERTQELRDLLKKGDLSRGCDLCKHQLEAKNFAGVHTSHYDHVRSVGDTALQNLWPVTMEFELSNICNLECVMCNGYFSSSIRRNREKLEPMPRIYDDAFVEQLRPFIPHLKSAKFLGGEPFLNPLYFKIWDLMVELNPDIHVSITTNATIMNEKVRRVLERLKPTIVISCESLEKKTYEDIRVNADFDQFIKNLEIFMNAAPASRSAGLTVCPMTTNWKSLPDIFEFCNTRTAVMGFNTVVWPPKHSIKNLPKKEIADIHKFLSKSLAKDFPESADWCVRMNRSGWQGLLNQISLWEKEAVDQAETF